MVLQQTHGNVNSQGAQPHNSAILHGLVKAGFWENERIKGCIAVYLNFATTPSWELTQKRAEPFSRMNLCSFAFALILILFPVYSKRKEMRCVSLTAPLSGDTTR